MGDSSDPHPSSLRPHPFSGVLRSRWLIPAVTFVLGIAVGGWLFSQSQPRSFLAAGRCEQCYKASDLAGLLASAGIQRAGAALPFVVKETERCIAIEHPFRKVRYHYIVFPRRTSRASRIFRSPTINTCWSA